MARPMLDDLELQQVQTIQQDGDQVWTQHSIPALEGDFFQGLGRRASQITLQGVLTGAEVADGLKNLRDKFRGAQPVSFVADIATATRIDQVLIEEMGVRELAGKPSRFEYAFTLREYTPATPTEVVIPPEPPEPPEPEVEESVLEVEVIVEGQTDFDHSRTTVRVEGTDQDGNTVSRTLTEDQRTDNVWEVDPFPAGRYTAFATTTAPTLTGSSETTDLPLGQRRRLTVVLRSGQEVAFRYRITYWFDKAFIEPCQRHVMRQVAQRAMDNPDEKLVIVGHTDESGSAEYNQSLSERRARGAYAFLTFGRDPASADAAVAEWDELRKVRTTGVFLTTRDTWGPRQYMQMLQDLGYYSGTIGDAHTAAVDQAVRLFQADNGLGVDGDVGDQTWPVLIRAYLSLDSLKVPEERFMPNAKDDCDHGFVHWLGCGERMPEPSTPRSDSQPPPDPPVTCGDPGWRPNRRTDFLFVRAAQFPCDVPKPVTFNLPVPNSGGTGWCLGPDEGPAPQNPCCYLTRDPNDQEGWLIEEAEPATIEVRGRITFEDGTPLANTEYVLIASDGEFMNGEQLCGGTGLKGTPLHGRTDADGNLIDRDGNIGYPGKLKQVGVFTLDIQAPVIARLEDQPNSEARGPVVCKRLDGSSPFNVVVVRDSCQLINRVYFEFSKSFVRPAGKQALRAVADFMQRSPANWRLLPIGHTDAVGDSAFNNDLGVRRAKAVYGFLTGNPPDPDNPARSIWLNLFHDAREDWGAREVQYMLQDLGFYCHHLTGIIDAETNRAIQAYKNQAGLGNNAVIDDAFLDRLFTDYIAEDGASVPANRFLAPLNWLSCGEQHPIDVRGGVPFAGQSELNRRVECIVFTQTPNPAPSSVTDCASYLNWLTPCEPRTIEFIGPKRNPTDPADPEEVLAFLEVANWQNAFDFDPPDANGDIHPTGDRPRADFIDRDPDRFFVVITDLDRRNAGTIRARIRAVDESDSEINPPVEFELQESPDRPGVFRNRDIANGRDNPMLLVSDEIDNGEINNGSAVGATPFRPRGIVNGALNDPVLRVQIGGSVIVEYEGNELGRIAVCDLDCIREIPVNIVILRLADGTPTTTEAEVRERVSRTQQAYMQCGLRFNVTIRTASVADMPAGVILSGVSGISVNPGALVDRTSLDPEERALIESPLNIRTAGGGGRTDTLQIFYANRIDGTAATAIAYPRVTYTSAAPGDDIFNLVMIGADVDENSTLPHEALHVLLNSFHDASSNIRTNLFFRSALGQATFADTTITSKKRIPEEQCERIMSNVSGLVSDQPGGTP